MPDVEGRGYKASEPGHGVVVGCVERSRLDQRERRAPCRNFPKLLVLRLQDSFPRFYVVNGIILNQIITGIGAGGLIHSLAVVSYSCSHLLTG